MPTLVDVIAKAHCRQSPSDPDELSLDRAALRRLVEQVFTMTVTEATRKYPALGCFEGLILSGCKDYWLKERLGG